MTGIVCTQLLPRASLEPDKTKGNDNDNDKDHDNSNRKISNYDDDNGSNNNNNGGKQLEAVGDATQPSDDASATAAAAAAAAVVVAIATGQDRGDDDAERAVDCAGNQREQEDTGAGCSTVGSQGASILVEVVAACS